MGHLLGAPPRRAGSRANPVSAGSPRGCATWIEVDSLESRFSGPGGCHRVRHRSATARRPIPWSRVRDQRLGHRARCSLFEAYGHLSSGQQSTVYPLGVRRPDVAADYPDHHMRAPPGFRRGCRSTRASASGKSTSTASWRTAKPSESPRSEGRVTDESVRPKPGQPSDYGARFRHHRHATRRHDIAARLPECPSTGGDPCDEGAAFHHRPLRTRSRLVPRAVSGRAPAGRYHWRSDALRALSPVGAAAIAGDRTGGKIDRVAAQPGRPGVLALPPGARHVATRRWISPPRSMPNRSGWRAKKHGSRAIPRTRVILTSTPATWPGANMHGSSSAGSASSRGSRFWSSAAKTCTRETAETFARVAQFLGISPDAPIPFTAHNQTSGPPLDPAIRRRLSRHFAPLNARLADLLGWDPGWRLTLLSDRLLSIP